MTNNNPEFMSLSGLVAKSQIEAQNAAAEKQLQRVKIQAVKQLIAWLECAFYFASASAGGLVLGHLIWVLSGHTRILSDAHLIYLTLPALVVFILLLTAQKKVSRLSAGLG